MTPLKGERERVTCTGGVPAAGLALHARGVPCGATCTRTWTLLMGRGDGARDGSSRLQLLHAFLSIHPRPCPAGICMQNF